MTNEKLPPLPTTPWCALVHEGAPYEPEWKSYQNGYTEDDMSEYAYAAVLAERELRAKENKKLRHMLFMAHGSEEHYLYGDDGERTCNTCWIDFNTDSPDVIDQKIYAYNMRKIAKLQAEGKWPPEFLKTSDAKLTGDAGIGEQK